MNEHHMLDVEIAETVFEPRAGGMARHPSLQIRDVRGAPTPASVRARRPAGRAEPASGCRAS